MRQESRRIDRRTFLRGAGVALGLPLLDAMQPRSAGGQPAAPRRMVAICTGLGLHAPLLFPEKSGKDYALTPYLEPLRELRRDFTLFSGLSHPQVDGGHASEACFLTAAPHPSAPSFKNTVSLDQFALEKLQPDTRFPGLVLSTGNQGRLSWTPAGVLIPSESRPSLIFRKLFLDGTAQETQQQIRRLREGRSVMDSVRDQARKIERDLGPGDREKLEQYLTSVREVEKRLLQAEAWAKKPKPRVQAKPPVDIRDPADFLGRTRLLFDLVHLALQTDSTRIITLNINGTNLVPPVPGVTIDWHNLSHHGKDPDKIEQLRKIELEKMKLFRDLLVKLKGSKEGGETLLDRTLVLFGSNLGNASSHDTKNLPILLAGGGFKHGQHLAFGQKSSVPLCRLYVSMLQRLGVETDTFATGKGTLPALEFA